MDFFGEVGEVETIEDQLCGLSELGCRSVK